ncbi:MAG TPA: isochorismatase family protein [Gemmatimonadales bacterium]
MVFWDVDTQHDFMDPDGRLYVPGAEVLVPALGALTTFAHAHRIPIVASSDDHVLAHAEISETPDWATTFPPHCLRGTPGQRKIAATSLADPLVLEPDPVDPTTLADRVRAHRGDFLLLKHQLDVFSNPNTRVLLSALAPEAVVLYGVATDFCNRCAVEGLLRERPGTALLFVTDAARAIDSARGEALVSDWLARGVRMVRTDDVVSGRALEPWL